MLDSDNVVGTETSACRATRPTWLSKANVWLCLTLMLLALTSLSSAQETRATMGGKVLDPQGAVVTGAAVTVTAEATGVKQRTTTNEGGNWRVQFLVPGPYHLEVEASGFKKAKVDNIQLQVADQKFLDVTLTVGAATDSVTVEATAPLIDTTAAVSGTIISTAHLEELPSQTNSPTLLIGLTPGAYTGLGTGASVTALWGNAGNSNVTVNGSSKAGTAAINYQLDGASDSNNGGQVAFVPPLDAVSEFKVVTNAYDAQIGRATGATINMSLKSGGNKFHGSLYEFNQNNFLNANRYENKPPTPVAPVHRNEYGGTIGGPVVLPGYDGSKKQTFFFFNYDGIRLKTPGSTGYMSIPTMKERQGDFSESFTVSNGVKYPITIYNPFSVDANGNRTQYTNNAIPQTIIQNSPVAKLLALMPAPDTAGDGSCSSCNNFLKRTIQEDAFGSYAWRVDHNWNSSHHSYASFRWNKMAELSYDPFGPNNLLQGLWQHRINRGITLDHAWVVSPKLLVDLRYAVSAWDASSNNTGAGVDPSPYGISSKLIALEKYPSIPLLQGLVSGAETGGLGTNQSGYTNDRNQDYTANITHTAGNHTFRYGAQFMVLQRAAGDRGQTGGVFNFTNKWTVKNGTLSSNPTGEGSNVASALLGLPNSGSLPVNTDGFWSQHYTAFYFQDDWRVTDRLTINAGLRWDFQRPVGERYNRFYSAFDPTLNLTDITNYSQPNYGTLISGVSTNRGVLLLQQYRPNATSFVARGGVLYAGVNDQSKYYEDTKYHFFQPRIGFAYRLLKNTVIRGGAGRFVQGSSLTYGQQTGFSASTPFTATNDNYLTPAATLDNPFPTGLLPATGNSLGIYTKPGEIGSFRSRDIARIYQDEVSLHVQHEVRNILIEVGGVYSKSHNLPVDYNINLPSEAAWRAAYGATFDANGKPYDTPAGDVTVTNPFKGAPKITSGTQTANTISAYQLLRPNPLRGDITETRAVGSSEYYGLQTKVERRFKNGFNLLQAFTYSKTMAQYGFLSGVPQTVSQKLDRQIDGNDRRFVYAVNSTYQLPFGRGKLFAKNVGSALDRLVGGWELSGIYNFASGTPITLPTNSSFFNPACNPSLGSGKTESQWFNTSCFVAYPSKSTTYADLHDTSKYPSWTGVQDMPGYNYVPTAADLSAGIKNGVYRNFSTRVSYNPTVFGNIRNPWTSDLTIGVRKAIQLTEGVKLQLRMDAFNALNHPQFTGPNTTAGNLYFGWLNGSSKLAQQNAPRAIQLSGKITF